MSISSWVDDRVNSAIDHALPQIQAMVEAVITAETGKIFDKLDAQTQALIATSVADVKALADDITGDVKGVAQVVTTDATAVSNSIFGQLKGLIPGL